MAKLSVVLATRNEEENIGRCLESVKDIADEIIVVDEGSTDNTIEIARSFGAKVYKVKHRPIFHISKQKALDYATGDWILQLDADERVTGELAVEIKEVIDLSNKQLLKRVIGHLFEPEPQSRRPERLKGVEGSRDKKIKLFQKHQKLIEQRDAPIGEKTGEITAFFVPRVNYFLGRPLKIISSEGHLSMEDFIPMELYALLRKERRAFQQKACTSRWRLTGKLSGFYFLSTQKFFRRFL